jgi:hypothetical protein
MQIRTIGRLAALTALAATLAGCAGANSAAFADFAKQIATDPRCGHTDRVQGNLGGVSGNNLAVFLERTCPPAGSVAKGAPETEATKP